MCRFWYHYRKRDGKMTVHFRGKCHTVDDVSCDVPCETKRNKRQPLLVMQGYAGEVRIEGRRAFIRGSGATPASTERQRLINRLLRQHELENKAMERRRQQEDRANFLAACEAVGG